MSHIPFYNKRISFLKYAEYFLFTEMNPKRDPPATTRRRSIHALAHSLIPRQTVPLIEMGIIVDEYAGLVHAGVPENNANHHADTIDFQHNQGLTFSALNVKHEWHLNGN